MEIHFVSECCVCKAKGERVYGYVGPGYRLPDMYFGEMKFYVPDGWQYVPQMVGAVCPAHDVHIKIRAKGKTDDLRQGSEALMEGTEVHEGDAPATPVGD